MRAASRSARRVGSIRTVLGSVSPHFRGLNHPGTLLNAEAVVEATQRGRRPPVGLAGQLHERRHERAADDEGVHQHGEAEAEAEHLDER